MLPPDPSNSAAGNNQSRIPHSRLGNPGEFLIAGTIPNPKDAVEDALKRAVCDGRIKLRAAQAAIAQNWLKAEAALGVSGSR